MYHSFEAFRNHKIQHITEKHCFAIGIELGRVLASVILIGHIFFIKNYRISTWLDQAIGVFFTIRVFTTQTMIKIREIFQTALYPHYSPNKFLMSDYDRSWVDKMCVKWELGLDVTSSNSGCIIQNVSHKCAAEVLEELSAIQKILPENHLLPYDENVDVERILQFLDESRPDLPKDIWVSIKPYRNNLIQFNDLLTKLESYKGNKTKHFTLQQILDAYTAKGKKNLLKDRPACNLRIDSMSLTFVYLGLTILQTEDASYGNWRKAKAYSSAAFEDFINIFIGWSSLLMGGQESFLECLTSRKDRSGLFTSMVLKNCFGVTAPRGELLSYSQEDAPPSQIHNSFFFNLRMSQSLTLYNHFEKIYPRLSDNKQKDLDKYFQEFIQTGKINWVSLITKYCTQEELNQIHDTATNLVEWRDLLYEAMVSTTEDWHPIIFSPFYILSTISYYGCQFNGFGVNKSLPQTDPWIQSLEKLQQFVSDLKAESYDNDEYKLTMLLHPDKLTGMPEKLKNEAEEIFKLISNAKDLLV